MTYLFSCDSTIVVLSWVASGYLDGGRACRTSLWCHIWVGLPNRSKANTGVSSFYQLTGVVPRRPPWCGTCSWNLGLRGQSRHFPRMGEKCSGTRTNMGSYSWAETSVVSERQIINIGWTQYSEHELWYKLNQFYSNAKLSNNDWNKSVIKINRSTTMRRSLLKYRLLHVGSMGSGGKSPFLCPMHPCCVRRILRRMVPTQHNAF